ncbi:MAG: dehydrogenase [Haloquadratum sp. J07HQX50]|nr:MAG: dehydrogenase [Haloquadratum sp. J07HQX50]
MAEQSYHFDNTCVIITGASAGIGRSIAQQFGKAGAYVINADISPDPKADVETLPTHEKIISEGGKSEYVETDISSPDDIDRAIERARDAGGVDVLVNNAGIFAGENFNTVTEQEFDNIYDVNVKGPFFFTQKVSRDLKRRDSDGAVINIASISSNLAQHGQTLYDSTKGAVRMLTRGFALELAEYGIRVNGIAPGQIGTEIKEGWSTDAQQMVDNDQLIKPVPMNRAGVPSDISPTALFLASDAAEYITGEIIHVDGGWQII